jgi:hypothetical protein
MSGVPVAMRRYGVRVGLFMIAYMLVLVAGLTLHRSGSLPQGAATVAVAVLTALPICGVFWAIFQLLRDLRDEYQRWLFVQQILWATAGTLCATTVWEFLFVYEEVVSGPRWFGVIWLSLFGLSASWVRWKA